MPARTLRRRDQQEVEVRLLELQFPRFLEPFHQRVFHFDFADESDPIAEAMGNQQDEAMEIEAAIFELELVEMEVHVAGYRGRPLRRVGGGGSLGFGRGWDQSRKHRRRREQRTVSSVWSRFQNVAQATLRLEPCQLAPMRYASVG